MDYGRAVRVARAAKGISQKTLAARSGKNQSYLSKIEAGQRTPSQPTIQEIARGLQIPPMLLTLLASEREDIKGLPAEGRSLELGQKLLDFLLAADDELEET